MAAGSRFSVEGRVVVVTGASAGLGEYFAKLLASEGARVVLSARRAERLAEVADAIKAAGGEALVVPADVTDYEQLKNLFARAHAEYGRIDVLVNNAGLGDGRLMRTEDAEPESFRAIIDTDLLGALWAAHAVAPYMLEQRSGSIINISSIGGDGGDEWRTAAYHAAKGGLNNLTRLLACEWGDRGVRVNAMSPNFVMTDMVRDIFAQTGLDEWVKRRTPLGRMSVEEDLAGPLLFLASDASAFVTGVVLPVDGGWGAGRGVPESDPPWATWYDETPAPAWGS